MRVLPRESLHRNLRAPRSCSRCSTLLNYPHVNERGGLGCQKVEHGMAHQPGVVGITPSEPPAPAAPCTPGSTRSARGPALPEHRHGGHQGTLGTPSRVPTFSHAGVNEQLLITDGHALSHADVSWKQPRQRQSLLPRKFLHSGTPCLALHAELETSLQAPVPLPSWLLGDMLPHGRGVAGTRGTPETGSGSQQGRC